MPSSMTSVANFTAQYQALITQLTTMTPAHLVIANIPDVTQVPYLRAGRSHPRRVLPGDFTSPHPY